MPKLSDKPCYVTKIVTIRGLLIWGLASVFFLYEFFSRTFIGTLASSIMKELSLTPLELSVIGAAYYLAYAGMQIPVGIIIDKFGVRKPLSLAVIICACGLLLFSFASGFDSLCIARLLMGLGSAFAFVSLLVLALNWFPKKNFGFFSGATQILGAIGPILSGAPLVAMLNATNNDWREVLYYIVLFGFLLAILIIVFVKDYPKQTHKIQRPKERKKTATLRNLKELFQSKRVLWIAGYAFSIFAAISVMGAIWGVYYLETHGIHRDIAAPVTSMIWLGLAIGSPLIGYISDKLQQRRIPLIFCAFFGFLVTLTLVLYTGSSVLVFGILYFCLGFSGAGQTLSFVCISENVEKNQLATALGLNNTAVMFGGAVVPPLVGLMIHLSIHHSSPYSSSDFTLGLAILPVLYFISMIIAWYKIPRKNVIRK